MRSRIRGWLEISSMKLFAKPLLVLAIPNCLSFASELIVPFGAGVFLGKMSTSELQGAALLGNMFSNACGNAIIFGLAMGLDSLAPQAEGSGKKALVGLYCQRGALISLLACIPIGLLWIFSDFFLENVFRIDRDISTLAASFVRARLAGLPAVAVFEVMRRFAQAQKLSWPTMVSCLSGAVVCLVATYFFILKWGLVGAGWAISVSQWLMLVVLLVVLFALRKTESLRGSWEWPSMRELFGGWGQYLRVAAPSSVSLLVEWGGWEVYAALSAQIGTVSWNFCVFLFYGC